jgi:hypothetical protein
MSRRWRFIVVSLLSCVTRRVKTKPVVVALALLVAGCATMPPPPYRAPFSPVWGYRGTDMQDLPLLTYAPTRRACLMLREFVVTENGPTPVARLSACTRLIVDARGTGYFAYTFAYGGSPGYGQAVTTADSCDAARRVLATVRLYRPVSTCAPIEVR